jgi:hypothetical protein
MIEHCGIASAARLHVSLLGLYQSLVINSFIRLMVTYLLFHAQVFNSVRSNAWRELIVITDNAPSLSSSSLQTAITNIQNAGIRMIGVGLNNIGQVDSNTIRTMSLNGGVYQDTVANDYNSLTSYVQQVVGYACQTSAYVPPVSMC